MFICSTGLSFMYFSAHPGSGLLFDFFISSFFSAGGGANLVETALEVWLLLDVVAVVFPGAAAEVEDGLLSLLLLLREEALGVV